MGSVGIFSVSSMLLLLIISAFFERAAAVSVLSSGRDVVEQLEAGRGPGADGFQMRGEYAVSASQTSRKEESGGAMREEVAGRSGGRHTVVGGLGDGEDSETRPQADFKMSCYSEGAPYQDDILMPGQRVAGGGQLGSVWSGDQGPRHGARGRRHAAGHTSRANNPLLQAIGRDDDVIQTRHKRGVTGERFHVWPGGIVPYTIDADFDNKSRDLLLKSMRHWMEHTCLQFVPRSDQKDYVNFLFGIGCCSSVGRQGGPQNVSLGYGCTTFGTIIHEIGHVIGFWHEQSRPDRDDHVTVVADNILTSERFNFIKHSDRTIFSLHQPYDYDSVMHYGAHDHSRGKVQTIITKGGQSIGQRRGLSVGDILQAKLLYRCHDKGVCGGTLFHAKGFILSPSYPQPMTPNVSCDWSIAAPEGGALKLQFLDVHLPESDDGKCDDAYIEVRKGLGELAPVIGRFCGNKKPPPIYTDGGVLWVRFKSGSKRYRKASGFAARYQSVSFYRYHEATRGLIKSFNYPLSFPPDSITYWLITVREGFIVLLRINELIIPLVKRTGCHGNYLMLIDGPTSQSKLISKICQPQKRVGVASSGPALRLELHSSWRKKKKMEGALTRFLAKFIARDLNECRLNNGGCAQACKNVAGHYVCGCRHGYHIAPDFHNCTDFNECEKDNGGCSHTCLNTIGSFHCACPLGYQLAPENPFRCVDTNECERDDIEVCDHFCHNTDGAFACTCEPAFILAPDGQQCHAIPGCGGYSFDDEGVITRPSIPANNTNPIDCVWFIDVPGSVAIQIRFELTDWPINEDCADYLTLRGEQGQPAEYPTICNQNDSINVYHTNSSRAWLHYHSDWPHEGDFTIEYFTSSVGNEIEDPQQICGGILNETGVIETPGFPHSYPGKVECVWRATNATIVRLHFEKFDVEEEPTCQFDYLGISDGNEDSEKIERYCGTDPPPGEIKISSGELWLVFRSDATVQGQGFRAVYEVQ